MTDKRTQKLEQKFNGKKSIERKALLEKQTQKKDHLIVIGVFAFLIAALLTFSFFMDINADLKLDTDWLNELPLRSY